MADWSTRVAETIELLSPLGNAISAKWRGDPRRRDMNVQRDKFPFIAGEYGKPLGCGADGYRITLYFDGENCDLAAAQFFEATKQVGFWQVTHPVYGYLELLLVGIEETNDPISSGGVVVVTTDWFEPLNLSSLQTTRQMAGIIDALFEQVVAVSAASFAANVNTVGIGNISAILSAASWIGVAMNAAADVAFTCAVMAQSAQAAQNQRDASSQDLANQIAATEADSSDCDPEAISLAMAGVAHASAIGQTDGGAALDNASNAIAEIAKQLPKAGKLVNVRDANKGYTAETAMEATVAATCIAMTYAENQTRAQSIQAAQALIAMFDDLTESLDDVSEMFEDLRADRQYFAQTQTYGLLRDLVLKTVQYLLVETFDLAIEKRFTLDRDKVPLQICVEEYGAAGEDKLDAFIEWNQLEGDEILILPAGREVVVYVEVAA